MHQFWDLLFGSSDQSQRRQHRRRRYRKLDSRTDDDDDSDEEPGLSDQTQHRPPHNSSLSYICRPWCQLPHSFRSVRLLLVVLFFILFVIQFKSGPFTIPTPYHYTDQLRHAPLPLVNVSLVSNFSHSSNASSIGHLANVHSADHRLVTFNRSLFSNIFSLASTSQNESTLSEMTTSVPSLALQNISRQTELSLNESSSDQQNTSNITSPLKACPLIPPKLVGRLKVLTETPSMKKLEQMLPEVEIGGRFRPKDCQSRSRVAIIIPFRDRHEHLRIFLLNLHPMLMRQNIDYGIFVVEQAGNGRFNRAKLMNVGFLEASKQYQYDCFIFHDVDLIPEDDRNLYTCPEHPRHMSVAVDKFHYRLPYKDIFGGVSALTKKQFEKVNGFSNEFWGWGGEDDDMSNRIQHYGFKISRYPANIARYKMLKHAQDAPNADRYKKLYNGWRRFKSDGISNIKYQVLDVAFRKLYTWVYVDLFPPRLIG